MGLSYRCAALISKDPRSAFLAGRPLAYGSSRALRFSEVSAELQSLLMCYLVLLKDEHWSGKAL